MVGDGVCDARTNSKPVEAAPTSAISASPATSGSLASSGVRTASAVTSSGMRSSNSVAGSSSATAASSIRLAFAASMAETLLISMRQPVSFAARRAFCPSLPIASDNCLSGTATTAVLPVSSRSVLDT